MDFIAIERRRRRSGFTLVEVLCSVVILSIALLAILSAMQGARSAARNALYLNIAANAAQSCIEELRSRQWDSIIAPPNSSDPSLPTPNVIAVVVSPYPTATDQELVLVSATVSWPDGQTTRKLTYETLITKYD